MSKDLHKEFSLAFVDYMPDFFSEGMLYISMKYSVVIHRCPCGCGEKVVTPLSPEDWILKYDGETISLYPSIGNWDLDCRSHYWIRNNKIINSYSWDEGKSRSTYSDNSENQQFKKVKRKKRWRWK